MKTRLTHYALLAAVAFGFACPPAHGQSTDRQAPSPIIATIDAQQTAPPVPSLISVLSQWPPFDQQSAANGEPSTTQLSQERAQTKHPRATRINRDRQASGTQLNQKQLFPLNFNKLQ